MKTDLLTTLKSIYYKRIPRKIQRFTLPLLSRIYTFAKRLYLLVSDIYPEVNLYRSTRRAHNSELDVLLAGRGITFRFLSDQILKTKPKTDNRGRRLIWKIPSTDRSQVNAILIEADQCYSRFLTRRGFYAIPEWILFTMDISMPVDKILYNVRKYHYDNLRLIRKYQLQYEVVRDLEKLRFFYDKMYVPYIKARFGRLALIAPLGQMENLLQRGELMLVKRKTEYISGALIHRATPTPEICYLGVNGGRRKHVKQGAVSALYLFTILWAKELGYRKLDFGCCRPILTDGVFRHKKKWGMRIQKSWKSYRTIYLSLCTPSIDFNEFLMNNPLICVDGKHLKGLLFIQEDDETNGQKIEAIKRKHSIPGLAKIETIFLGLPDTLS